MHSCSTTGCPNKVLDPLNITCDSCTMIGARQRENIKRLNACAEARTDAEALMAADRKMIETVTGRPELHGVSSHTLPAGTIDATLAERGDRYGSFEHHAVIAQDLQDVIRKQAGWNNLASDQKQALTVICDKIARMLNGDPTYRDNWHDIVGYAKLVDDRMLRDEQAKDKK